MQESLPLAGVRGDLFGGGSALPENPEGRPFPEDAQLHSRAGLKPF
jgi:hypothetical protein